MDSTAIPRGRADRHASTPVGSLVRKEERSGALEEAYISDEVSPKSFPLHPISIHHNPFVKYTIFDSRFYSSCSSPKSPSSSSPASPAWPVLLQELSQTHSCQSSAATLPHLHPALLHPYHYQLEVSSAAARAHRHHHSHLALVSHRRHQTAPPSDLVAAALKLLMITGQQA